jgi:hypothetical protein
MKHNKKILCAAVTAALSLSASTAYAAKGEFQVCKTANSSFSGASSITTASVTDCTTSGAVTFASELFVGNNPIVPTNGKLRVAYTLNEEVCGSCTGDKGFDFNAIYTLTGGTFGNQVSPNDDYFLSDTTPSKMSVTAPVGGKGDSQSVSFFVQAKQQLKTTSSPMYFQFNIDDATTLATPGSEIKMGLQLIANSRSLPNDGSITDVAVAKSSSGVTVDISSASGIAEISVATGAKEFVGTNTTAKTADLGTLSIQSPVSGVLGQDLSEWTLGVSSPKPVSDQSSFTVSDGNFAASTTAKGKGRVFLDLDSNSTFGTGDITADTVEEGEAIWKLTSDEIRGISLSSPVKIVIEADGETAINDFEDQPTATLKIVYGSGDPASYSGRLRQIKRDGMICTLFNVPSPSTNATDNFNLRITNTSADAGTVLGTLRDEKGAEILSNQELVNSLAPDATAYLNAEAIQAITKNQAWIDANPTAPLDASGAPTWSGRATLTLAGNLRTMEAYGLLREKTGGAPLLNISTGASGNGCQ